MYHGPSFYHLEDIFPKRCAQIPVKTKYRETPSMCCGLFKVSWLFWIMNAAHSIHPAVTQSHFRCLATSSHLQVVAATCGSQFAFFLPFPGRKYLLSMLDLLNGHMVFLKTAETCFMTVSGQWCLNLWPKFWIHCDQKLWSEVKDYFHPQSELLQCSLFGATLEDLLEVATGPECMPR